MNTIVIQTALSLEQDAIVSKLNDVTTYEHPLSKTQYRIGYYNSNGNKLKIVIGRTNQTNTNAGIETERIIQEFKPTYIFFVGVAGGLKDVKIGDVVIGSDVYGYERGKIDTEYKIRPRFGFSSYELEAKAVEFASDTNWAQKTEVLSNTNFPDKISVISGTIASGDKVVASINSELYQTLKTFCSHAIAVEMEGLGFLEACRPYPLIKSLLIRGISDLVDGKEQADKEGSQPYASKNATEFLFGFIDYLRIQQIITPSSLKQNLFEIITKLYPEGIKDKGIWLRAGGDLSMIQLSTAGKTQWIEALTLVENGGGGDIDFTAIIREMKIDYPKNESLKTLS
jgi:adenosylhomocysteine nucleosidase